MKSRGLIRGPVGINLGDLVVKHETAWEDLAGQRVAVDAYNTLYQFLATIRGPDGTPLRDAQGRVTSHLSGLLQRTGHMIQGGIQPVYVFDGAPHSLKRATLDERRRIKDEAQRAYEKAVAAGDMETARSKAQQTSTLDKTMVLQAKELLDALGVPWIDAPGEGEAQAAFMTAGGLVDATASQDYDSVLFGAPLLYRNLSVGGRRKVAGKQAWVDVSPERIDLEETLASIGLTRPQLIDVALMVGTDYNPGVKGIGPKTALKLVREAGSLEEVVAKADAGDAKGAMWEKVRTGREGLEPVAELRKIFLEPEVSDVEPPQWRGAQVDKVRSLLVDDFRFRRERVDSALQKFDVGRAERAQSSLGDF